MTHTQAYREKRKMARIAKRTGRVLAVVDRTARTIKLKIGNLPYLFQYPAGCSLEGSKISCPGGEDIHWEQMKKYWV